MAGCGKALRTRPPWRQVHESAPGSKEKIAPALIQVRTQGRRHLRHARRRRGIAAHRRASGAQDAGLLAAYGFPVRAQPLGVIDADGADQRHVRIPHVHRVQPAAQPHFEHHDFAAVGAEQVECGEGAEFKISERGIAARRVHAREGGA